MRILTLAGPLLGAALGAAGACLAEQSLGASALIRDERPFLDENAAAMNRMMAGMSIKPSGDVDRDFVDMMAPHHQGAIDMAVAVLRYGHNEQIRRLAQEIIVDQQQEIVAMRRAVGEPLPPPGPAPSIVAPDGPSSMGGMTTR